MARLLLDYNQMFTFLTKVAKNSWIKSYEIIKIYLNLICIIYFFFFIIPGPMGSAFTSHCSLRTSLIFGKVIAGTLAQSGTLGTKRLRTSEKGHMTIIDVVMFSQSQSGDSGTSWALICQGVQTQYCHCLVFLSPVADVFVSRVLNLSRQKQPNNV